MIFKFFFNVYLLLSYNLPLENGLTLHLIKIKYFLHMDALCQVCLKLAQWLWKCSVFFHYQVFCYQFLLKKKHGPSFEKFKSPLAQGSFVTSLVKGGLLILEKKTKMLKVHDNNYEQQKKLTCTFGSGELKIKQNNKLLFWELNPLKIDPKMPLSHILLKLVKWF